MPTKPPPKKPAAKKPAVKKPAAKKPAAKKPAVKKPAVKKPAAVRKFVPKIDSPKPAMSKKKFMGIYQKLKKLGYKGSED